MQIYNWVKTGRSMTSGEKRKNMEQDGERDGGMSTLTSNRGKNCKLNSQKCTRRGLFTKKKHGKIGNRPKRGPLNVEGGR